jgi:hypothetical protein
VDLQALTRSKQNGAMQAQSAKTSEQGSRYACDDIAATGTEAIVQVRPDLQRLLGRQQIDLHQL